MEIIRPGVAVALGSSPAGRTRDLTPSSSTGAAPRDLSRYQLDLKLYSRKELSCVSTLRRLDVMHFALLITEPFSVFRSWQSREPGNRERGETKSRTCHDYWNANLATITCSYKPKIFLTSQTLSLLFQTSPLIPSNMSAYCEESSSYSCPQLKSVATQAKP